MKRRILEMKSKWEQRLEKLKAEHATKKQEWQNFQGKNNFMTSLTLREKEVIEGQIEVVEELLRDLEGEK